MAITQDKKKEVISEVQNHLDRSKLTVLADYKGLNVKETQELRKTLRDEGVGYKVAKNTLVRIAVKAHKNLKDIDESIFNGPTALAFGYDDEVAPAKLLVDFAKSHNALEVLGGFNAAGDVFDADQIKQLAQLPSKDVLRGQLVGTIAAPLSGFVNVLTGNTRGLINVLNARSQTLSS